MKLSEIAARLRCERRGHPDPEITAVQPLDEAGPHALTFVSHPKYWARLPTTRAAAVILPVDAPASRLPSLRTATPDLAVAHVLDWLYPPEAPPEGVHPTAVIAPTARLGPHAFLGPYVVIGEGVEIGAYARIFAHVVIYPAVRIGTHFTAHAGAIVQAGVTIGHRVVLQSGVVVGGAGFGYVSRPDGTLRPKRQVGRVVIEDDVDLGANTTVDRATVGTTRVGTGAKLDNLVQVGHGAEIGAHAVLCAQVGLAGSTTLGAGVQLGGQVGVAGHLTIGAHTRVAAQSGVPGDVPAHSVVGGTPAEPIGTWRRMVAALPKLPALLRRVRRLEQALAARRPDAD